MNDKPKYKPIRTVDSSSYDRERGTHRTKQVHYQLADGTTSYVEVPVDQYTPEVVQQHLEAAAATHEQIMSLRPGYSPAPPTPDTNPWGSSG